MAELLTAEQWPEADSPLGRISEALPEDYLLVAEPTVRGQRLDGVLVGPQGLVVLYLARWQGEVTPSPSGPWIERLPDGSERRHRNPLAAVRAAEAALRAFARDEGLGLPRGTRRDWRALPIYHLAVLVHETAHLAAQGPTTPAVVPLPWVQRTVQGLGGPVLDATLREELAVALRDRALTSRQRASEPFSFRGGGIFGSGKRVRTTRAALRHCDRHPEDGIHHLRNGTLEAWFAAQGAHHLATLAREAMRRRGTNDRAALEWFLIATGTVRRPRLVARPRRVWLGHVLSGQGAAAPLRLRKGRGRGYLYGEAQPAQPWLRLEPRYFHEGKLEAMVSAESDTLPISNRPHEGQIVVDSSASAEPQHVDVHLRVVGHPSPLNRVLWRPLLAGLFAGALGAAVGLTAGLAGAPTPWSLAGLALPLADLPAWTAACAALWLLAGIVRGALQPPNWPVLHAAARWLMRTAVWAAILLLLARVALWSAQGVVEGPIGAETRALVLSLALALGVLPGVAGEAAAGRASQVPEGRVTGPFGAPPPKKRLADRPLLSAALGLALVLVVIVGVRLAVPAWQQYGGEGTVEAAQGWLGERLVALQGRLDAWVDDLYIRRYDRRAPVQPTAAPTPVRPTAAPEVE